MSSRLRFALTLVIGLALPSTIVAQADPYPGPDRPITRHGAPLPGRLVMGTLLPGGHLGPRTPPAVVVARWAFRLTARVARQRMARRDVARLAVIGGVPLAADTTLGQVPAAPPPGLGPLRAPGDADQPAVFGALGRYADLGLQLRAGFQMKMDRLTNARCTAADVANPVSGCQGGFPTPALDQQFNIRAGGVVGERVHVNVDYDTEREFSANNNINVYYQGLEDEILRRVEVGNVSFNAPQSRFITAAIPANSFGVQARAQLGAFEFNAIVAQQKGSQLRTRVYTVGETVSTTVDREARDLDYESGRFFTLLDQRTLPGYPAFDVLNPAPGAIPADRRPVQVRVYRLRAQTTLGINPNIGGIDAVALRDDSPQRVGPLPWELLIQGRDYFLDPSGLWFALESRVGDRDFLAVSYVTASGDTAGTFPATNGDGDTLFLLYEPRRGPDVPTFYHELRNVYRAGSANMDRRSLSLAVVVNESERPVAGGGTYLAQLGLAEETDPTALDEFNRVFPRARDPNDGAPIRDLFVVFPHLQPFADSTRLSEGERNDSLYRTPTYLLDTQGPPSRARLRFRYQDVGGGDRSTLSLGAFQIRDGSEKLYIGGTQLQRGVHYNLVYEIGQVTFLNPDSLFPHGQVQVRAEFEENQAFDIAPKSILGLTTRYDLGTRGEINVIGLLQRESSPLTRPGLGFEPQANFIGGVNTQLRFRPDVLTQALDALPLIETTVPSALTLNGELAISRPNPNSAGAAWVEEFDNSQFRQVALFESTLQLGSRPSSGRGLPATHLGPAGEFAVFDAVPLVWQNIVQSGNRGLQFFPQDIDSTIVLTGTSPQPETVLWFTLMPDTVGGAPHPATGSARWFRPHTPGPRWRSLTQALNSSGIGTDLSRTEFIEFWTLEDARRGARENGAILVMDFGTVFEDAVALGPTSFTVAGGDTVFEGVRPLGQGVLDTEKDSLTNTFNALRNDVGILGDFLPAVINASTGVPVIDFPMCEVETIGIVAFPRGDLAANCTRGNGRADGEDLNNDNRLDQTVGVVSESFFRYVFPIGGDRYFVRTGGREVDGAGRELVWRLYRIPFREDTLQIGTPNVRQIQAVRFTLVAPDRGPVEQDLFFALARLRLVGAPWLKRAATPIVGLGGSEPALHGEVIAAVATTENGDLGYEPPPGVFNQADRRGAAFEFGTRQVNEASLRLLARDLRPGERAEAFLQFPDQAGKNFLRYRTLRVWARGRGPGWEDGDLQFFIKVGRDRDNFYLYRTSARSVSWEPEVVIELERWLRLRGAIEARWLAGEPPSGAAECGGDSLAYVACDGGYLVQVRDPGVAPPNLARVTEIAVGMLRVDQSVYIEQAELWVDDIRLTDVVNDVGLAGAVDVQLQAADVATASFGYQAQDANFQQLGQEPTWVNDGALRVGGTLRADKLLPDALGLNVPIAIQHTRSAQNPFYLNRSDLRADALPGLRESATRSTALQASLRRVRRSTSFLGRTFADPWIVSLSLTDAHLTQPLSTSATTNRTGRLEYRLSPGTVTTAGAPGFLRALVDALPGFIAQSDFARALTTSRLRISPFQVRGAVTLIDNRTTRRSFRVPVELSSDAAIRPQESRLHTLRAEAGVDLRPYSGLNLRVDWTSTRDLRDYGDSTTLGRVLAGERESVLGRNVGFERQRTLVTAINVAPVVASWLQPRLSLGSSFTFLRDPNGRDVVRVEGDTAGAFRPPESITASRRFQIGAVVEPGQLLATLVGAGSGVGRLVTSVLQPVDLTRSYDVRGSFDRPPFAAPLDFQLALGGIDAFRAREGVPATAAGQSSTNLISSGLRLPLGLTLRGSYRDAASAVWARRFGMSEQSLVTQHTDEWGPIGLNWLYSPRWGLRTIVSSINAGVTLRWASGFTEQAPATGVGETVRTETSSRSLVPTVSLTLPGNVVASAQYSQSRNDQITAGNVTTTDRADWTVGVNFRFRPPRSLIRLPNPLTTTLRYSLQRSEVCLERPDTGDCRLISHSQRRVLDARLNTGFSTAVRGGASFLWTRTEQAHLSTRLSQVTFTIFAEVYFNTGLGR